MEMLHFTDDNRVQHMDDDSRLPASGYVWLDFIREQDNDWAQRLEQLAGIVVHERHVKDSFNLDHASFFDQMEDYEMLIFRGLANVGESQEFVTRPTVFLLTGRCLVTIRHADSVSVNTTKPRLLNRSIRIPRQAADLMHLLLTVMVDRFLALRDPLADRFENWRNELLDPRQSFKDWLSVLEHTRYLRSLERLCDEQDDALMSWQESTDISMDDQLAVRYRDLREHIQRVTRFADEQIKESETAVQLHFSFEAHRTNEIIRVLTVLSAIFMPLTLLAGIFGMNFENMPELKLHYGYFYALGGMASLAIVLLAWFRIKRWI